MRLQVMRYITDMLIASGDCLISIQLFYYLYIGLPYFSSIGIKPQVKFSSDDIYTVTVTHWQTLESKEIPVADCLQNFLLRVRNSFRADITTLRFCLYRLPYNYTSIDQRTKIDNDQSYDAYLELYRDLSKYPPLLYVWNDETSPEKLPEVKEAFDRSDTRTNTSRDSTNPHKAKVRDNKVCLVCSMEGISNLEACHIFERKHYNLLSQQLKDSMLDDLELHSIDNIQNLITMCEHCHKKIDDHLLGIYPETMTLIVTELIRDEISNPYTTIPYQNLHGKAITQSDHNHKKLSKKAVKYRFETYFSNAHKDKHYCPICTGISKSELEHGQHLKASKCSPITKKVGAESNEQNDMVGKFSFLTIDESAAYESFKETFMIEGKTLNMCIKKELQAFLLSKSSSSSGNNQFN